MNEKTTEAGGNLITAIADAVADKLNDRDNAKQRVYDIDQAAAYLGLTTEALRKIAGIEIPVLTVDRRLRFDKRDLDRWIDQAPRRGVKE